MTAPELILRWADGEVDLNGWNEGPYGDYKLEIGWNGADWGNPAAVRRQVMSALADGSRSAKDRHDNREVVLQLRIVASDGKALAGGEIPLSMADTRRCELIWTPPDSYAPSAVFEVISVDVEPLSGRDVEELALIRSYTLTLTCLPWVRSIEPVIIEALPPTDTVPVVLDDCTSITGWSSADPAVSFSTTGGMVSVDASADLIATTITLTKTLARSRRYLGIAVSGSGVGWVYWGNPLTVTTTTGTHTVVQAALNDGFHFYDLPASLGSVLSLTLDINTGNAASFLSPAVDVLTIAEVDTPSTTLTRQMVRSIPTPGSARADGSLAVEARNAAADGSGDPLGQILVYTGTDYDPRLSPYSTGTRTADTPALSGSKEAAGTTFVFDRPPGSVPTGSYSVWVHVKGTASSSVTFTLLAGSTTTGGSSYISGGTVAQATKTFDGSGYNLFNLGTGDLPGFDVGAASGLNLRFLLTTSASVTVDEVLLFNRTTGRLTVVDTRLRDSIEEVASVWTVIADGGATRLFLDAASVEGNERIIAGSPSREMALPVNLNSELVSYDGAHVFTPDATFVYVGTTGTIDPVVTGTFRPAWHTHPAE